MAVSFVPGWGFGVMQSKLRLFLCLWAPLRSLAVERVPLWGAGTSQLGFAPSLELHYSIFWLEIPLLSELLAELVTQLLITCFILPVVLPLLMSFAALQFQNKLKVNLFIWVP